MSKQRHNFGTKRFKRKIPFYISCPYRAEVADTAVCTPDCARCQNRENTHTHTDRHTDRTSTVTLAHARSEGYCSCPVCLSVCVCVSVRSFLPPRASRSKYRYVRVHSDTEKTFIIVNFAKNASFRSYGVICLPRMPLTTPEPQNTDTNGIHATWARHYYSQF